MTEISDLVLGSSRPNVMASTNIIKIVQQNLCKGLGYHLLYKCCFLFDDSQYQAASFVFRTQSNIYDGNFLRK